MITCIESVLTEKELLDIIDRYEYDIIETESSIQGVKRGKDIIPDWSRYTSTFCNNGNRYWMLKNLVDYILVNDK